MGGKQTSVPATEKGLLNPGPQRERPPKTAPLTGPALSGTSAPAPRPPPCIPSGYTPLCAAQQRPLVEGPGNSLVQVQSLVLREKRNSACETGFSNGGSVHPSTEQGTVRTVRLPEARGSHGLGPAPPRSALSPGAEPAGSRPRGTCGHNPRPLTGP